MTKTTVYLFWTLVGTGLVMTSCGGDNSGPSTGDTSGTADVATDTAPTPDTTPLTPDTTPPTPDTTPPISTKTAAFVVQLASAGAGEMGIAVRVVPPAGLPRYEEGAPIMVYAPGGWGTGSFTNPEKLRVHEHGVVGVEFLLPGGKTPDGESGGNYDVRGPACNRAVADATRWALGLSTAMDGSRITDHLPYALTDEVGLIGSSNGGNAALAALGSHGDELLGVRWFSAWESPIGDQFAAVDLNNNPYYVPGTCGATSCPTPGLAEGLSWDPTGETRLVTDSFVLKTGRLVLAGAEGPNGLFTRLSAGYDANGIVRAYPSQELGEQIRLVEGTLFGSAAPDWLETNANALADYWLHRDGALHIQTISEQMPNLLVMHLQNSQDHVQSQPDHPHAMAHLQGWHEASHGWWRLNPDAAYMSALVANAAAHKNLPDNDANTLLQYPNGVEQTVPKNLGQNLSLASVLELCDRTHLNNTEPNLNGVLVTYEGPTAGANPGSPGNGNGLDCEEGQRKMCCGDGVCDGPENAQNCAADCL